MKGLGTFLSGYTWSSSVAFRICAYFILVGAVCAYFFAIAPDSGRATRARCQKLWCVRCVPSNVDESSRISLRPLILGGDI